jgi:hypothetical protein
VAHFQYDTSPLLLAHFSCTSVAQARVVAVLKLMCKTFLLAVDHIVAVLTYAWYDSVRAKLTPLSHDPVPNSVGETCGKRMYGR